MSLLDGVVQCWPLSETCEVWWDAYAASAGWAAVTLAIGALVVAWIGIAVTAASAIAVWRLGVEANRLAHAPAEAVRQEARRERVVLLSALYGELLQVSSVAGAWHELVEKFGIDHMLDNDESRNNAAESLRDIDMPLAKSVISRLHVLPAGESSALAQCLGLVSLLHTSIDSLKSSSRGSDRAREVIERLIADTTRLDVLSSAMSAICEQQIYPVPD